MSIPESLTAKILAHLSANTCGACTDDYETFGTTKKQAGDILCKLLADKRIKSHAEPKGKAHLRRRYFALEHWPEELEKRASTEPQTGPERIIQALQVAGTKGACCDEIAAQLNVKSGSISKVMHRLAAIFVWHNDPKPGHQSGNRRRRYYMKEFAPSILPITIPKTRSAAVVKSHAKVLAPGPAANQVAITYCTPRPVFVAPPPVFSGMGPGRYYADDTATARRYSSRQVE